MEKSTINNRNGVRFINLNLIIRRNISISGRSNKKIHLLRNLLILYICILVKHLHMNSFNHLSFDVLGKVISTTIDKKKTKLVKR